MKGHPEEDWCAGVLHAESMALSWAARADKDGDVGVGSAFRFFAKALRGAVDNENTRKSKPNRRGSERFETDEVTEVDAGK